VTQGTNTIEETAFVLDVLVDAETPVVVTGAMRNPTLPGAYGPANLLASIQVVARAAARGLGALVVLTVQLGLQYGCSKEARRDAGPLFFPCVLQVFL
jgi:L-asparaginase